MDQRKDPKGRNVTEQDLVYTFRTGSTRRATLDVTPAWFESVKPVPDDRIRFPVNYNRNSLVDVRTYKCLATYRSMMERTDQIDFIARPFISSVESIETVVVTLNEVTHRLESRLTFTNVDFEYDDDDYRMACGVITLSNINSFLASEGKFEAAKFNLSFNGDYDQITATPQTLKSFVVSLVNDISTLLECQRDFIRVFSITQTSPIVVELGITTLQRDETIRVADSLKRSLSEVSSSQHQNLLQHLVPEPYNYTLKSAPTVLQLKESDFDLQFNRAYLNAGEETRGGYPYYFPKGWYRHALKVIDKYPDDHVWLGMDNSAGEWAVAYYGTISRAARSVVGSGLLRTFITRDAYKDQARQQNSNIPDVKGLYVATHCEEGTRDYTSLFELRDSNGATKNYQIVFQCRVQPGKFTKHQEPMQTGMTWRVFDEKAIRPYGLLLNCCEEMENENIETNNLK